MPALDLFQTQISRALILALCGSLAIACDSTPSSRSDLGVPDDAGAIDMGGADAGPIVSTDEDGDGLDDDWERMNGLDPTRDDSAEDFDGDGLTNLVEFLGGTLANDLDSDDDGLSDGEEDANRNGMVDPGETNPASLDTDGDGLTDGQELGRTSPLTSARPGVSGTDPGVFRADENSADTTDPTLADTDGDGVPDGIEDANRNGRLDAGELNPLDLDSDDDGLSDGMEDRNGNGVVDAGETDPRLADTDLDGISDGVELGVTMPIADPDGQGPLRGTDTTRFRPDADPTTMTDPLSRDTDGDGVADGDEDWNRNGAFEPPNELNPLVADTDGDGVPDGDEGIAIVCAASSLRQVNLHALASADISMALPNSYSEVAVLRDAQAVGVGLMFQDPTSGVVGFAISKTPAAAQVAQEKQANRNLLDGVANLANEQDRALRTWEGFDAVFTTANASRGGISASDLAAQMAEQVAQAGALTGALPSIGGTPGNFTVYFETILRTPQRAIVLGAIAPAPTSDAQLIALADLANGTGIAQFGDFTGLGCDQLQTPPGSDILDLLWVVDNSGSMADEQANVAAVGQEMVALLSSTQLSWRLALTSTEEVAGSIVNSGVAGFTVSTPRAQAEAQSQAWAAAVGTLGVGGSGEERGLVVGQAAAQLALQNVSANENAMGFREGASVIVVHMSDEEDYSVKEASGGSDANCPENQGKQNRIEALKNQYLTLGQNPAIAGLTTFAIHGISPGPDPALYCDFNTGSGDCLGASHYGRSYIEVAQATGGGSGSICGDMGQVVQDIIRAGAGIASQLELTQPPISSTIRVVIADENGSFVGQPDVPRSRQNGFDYAFELDVNANQVKHKIVFFGNARPPANRELMVAYRTWEDGSPDPGGPVDMCPPGTRPNPDTFECEIDPTCGDGCPQDMPCNPMTGMCEPEDPCMGQCVEGESCLDGICVPEDPCMGQCEANEFCDTNEDPPVCKPLV